MNKNVFLTTYKIYTYNLKNKQVFLACSQKMFKLRLNKNLYKNSLP